MRPLVNVMVQADSNARPAMDEVMDRFENTMGGLSSWKLRSGVKIKGEHPILAIPQIVKHWHRRVGFIVGRIPPIPSAEPRFIAIVGWIEISSLWSIAFNSSRFDRRCLI